MAKSSKSLHKRPKTFRAALKWYWIYAERRTVRAFLRRNIPGNDRLFFRIHKNWVKNGEAIPGAFQDRGDHPMLQGMSVDWERYSSAEASLQRARMPQDNGIVAFKTALVRALPGLEVDHDPYWKNRAHSHVKGEKDVEVRMKLKRACQWIIEIRN